MRLGSVLVHYLTTAALCLCAAGALAQQDLGPAITLSNASFEDVPRQGHPPARWYDCGFSAESPVDVHPASMSPVPTEPYFGVDARAFDGNTYLGMVVRDNETYEAVSQRLLGGPLRAGKCYTFSIYMARETRYLSQSRTVEDSLVNYKTPAKLRIFGGMSYCNRGEVLAESSVVANEEWLQYNFRFEPKRDHNYIVLEAYYKTPVLFPYNGNLLLDAAGKIQPIACDEDEDEDEEPVLADTPTPEQPDPDLGKPEVPIGKPTSRPEPTPTKPLEPTGRVATAPAPDKKIQGRSRRDLRAGTVMRVDKLLFKADSSAIQVESRPVLEEIYEFLEVNDDVVIEVGGHTNGTPNHEYADWLSQERADAVVGYLATRGIPRERLQAKGYGKRKPIATNRTPTGRRRNQRVEITVVAIDNG